MRLLLLFLPYAIVLSAALARAGHRSRTAPSSESPLHHPSRVLIVGATGGTGRQLVTQALERGYAVTALVRNPSRLQVEDPQLTVIQGDVLDYASVEARSVELRSHHQPAHWPDRYCSDDHNRNGTPATRPPTEG